jgi:SAM-dependent methyltransferase
VSAGDDERRAYAERLVAREDAAWKRWLRVQAPYAWNLRRAATGHTLEVGCGIGRNLRHLRGRAVGIDPNPHAVEIARRRGLEAWLPEQFRASPLARAGAFQSLLFAHVLEHVPRAQGIALVADHLRWLAPGGRVVLIAPQEAGFRSDPTHVEWLDFAALGSLLEALGLERLRAYSFPFPRALGRIFPHNEFVVLGRKPAGTAPRAW